MSKVQYAPVAPDPVDAAAIREVPKVVWPAPGSATVDVPAGGATSGTARTRAGDTPVSVGAASTTDTDAAGSGAAPARVTVQVLDRAALTRQGREGVLLRIARADEAERAGRVSIEVDYSGFRYAVGGDWAARLRLVALPECALRTPERPECRGTPLPTRNDVTAGRLSGEVNAAPASGLDAGDGDGTLIGIMAGASGSAGSFAVTSLSESATWGGGGNTGEFTWSYPMRVPPAPGGLAPELTVTYSSSSVDGRTVATNNQPSWAGEGFDVAPGGSIERRYKPCLDDMGNGANNTTKTGDLCWATDNAWLSLNGMAGELIRDDATGTWRLRGDNGSRIERLTGASNGAHDGEHWRVTTTDGTQYYFGLNRLPGWTTGKPETQSTLLVPVFGNHSGEPCHGSSFTSSYCNQAWRWSLDYIVDRHGDTASYFYAQDTNKYGRGRDASAVSSYDRDGYLTRIEYGQREGQVYSTPPVGTVTFAAVDRCAITSGCVKTNKDHYPDTPWDLECTGSTCPDKFVPTFWSSKRLASIATTVWDAAAAKQAPVDTWKLRHSFPDPGDGTRAGLFLDGITHIGNVGGTVTLPEVTFSGIQLANRVDGIDGIPAMKWWRVSAVHSESGGQIAVTYAQTECAAPDNLPTPDSNTKRCMPVRWTPEGLSERLDWFHKYVVAEVSEHDRTSGLLPAVTSYRYIGGAAWRYADGDGITQDKYRTWSQWRGYEKVQVRKGHPDDGPVTLTELRFLRGMHGDKIAAGGTKSVILTPAEGPAITDEDALAGRTIEETVYLGDSTTEVSRTITHPWMSPATATAVRSWGTRHARIVATGTERNRVALPGGGFLRRQVDNTFDTAPGRVGMLLSVNDRGDPAKTTDDKCTRYSYANNTTRWLFGLRSREETVGVACSATPTQGDVLREIRNYYDDNTTLGAVDRGNLTRSEMLIRWSGTTPVYQTTSRNRYDAHGRVLESYDAGNALTTTAYTPALGGPTTSTVVTNPLGHEIRSELIPAWGAARTVTDPAGQTSEGEFDALGRLVKVWQGGRVKGRDTPSTEYAYLLRTDGPIVVSTRTLKHDGTYLTTYELYDGMLRARQSQTPAPGGGRTIRDTIYNSRGEVAREYGPYYNDAPPGFDLVQPDTAPSMETQTLHDGAGRPTVSITKVQGVEQWRQTTTYGGDEVTITPPAGAGASSVTTDARGQITKARQYQSNTPTGAYDTTEYTYTRNGQLETIKDQAGSTWRYTYNLLGQKIREEQPDRGVTTYTYDDAGRLATQTDARQKTVAFSYDAIGRKTAAYEGAVGGPKLAEWTYDTVRVGSLSSSTRFVGANAYIKRVTGYDAAGRVTGTEYVIPPAETGLAGTYRYESTYLQDGSIETASMPAIGGLPAETMTYGYDTAFSLPVSMRSNVANYVASATYTPYAEPWQINLSSDATGLTKFATTTFEYHVGTRRLGRVLVERDGTPTRVSNATYTWSPAGNLTKIAEAATGVATHTQCFSYDQQGRLTTAWTPVSGNCAYTPSASALGGPAPYYQSWTFDKTGNRVTQTNYSTAGNTVSTSTYPAAGQPKPHAVNKIVTTGPGGTRTDQYTYDEAGNTLTRNLNGVTQTLDWDVEGRLSKVTQGTNVTSYVYGADGERLVRRDPTGTTLYLGTDEIRRSSGGAVSGTREYGFQGKTVAVRTSGAGNGELWYLAADHHGTNTIAIKASDLSVQRRYSTPYGEARGPAPASWPGEKGFVGGTKDPSTGLTHLGAREYDPAMGRFLSVDPLIDPYDPQQLNGYSYANNNATSKSDANGEFPLCFFLCNIIKRVIKYVKDLIHRLRSPKPKCSAAKLNCTIKDINRMTVKQRKKLVQDWAKLYAAKYGAQTWFQNIMGVLDFMDDNHIASPDSWESWVDSTILHGVQGGLAIVEGKGDGMGNPGAKLWAKFFRYSRTHTGDDNVKRRLWSEAEETTTRFGYTVAEGEGVGVPWDQTSVLLFAGGAHVYRWGMRNQATVDRVAGGTAAGLCGLTGNILLAMNCARVGAKATHDFLSPESHDPTYIGGHIASGVGTMHEGLRDGDPVQFAQGAVETTRYGVEAAKESVSWLFSNW